MLRNTNKLRVIKTARSLEAINEAASKGFKPLVKPVKPSPEINGKYSLLQDKRTGIIKVINDLRSRIPEGMETVIGFTSYYPYRFESPFAAYLIPKDIRVGEWVWLEDIIEDLVASKWNQGDTYRLNAYEAVWNGTDFTIDFVAPKGDTFIG